MLGRTEWRQEDVNLAFRLRYTYTVVCFSFIMFSGHLVPNYNFILHFRYFYTGESVLSKIVDNEMVALMTDNMYQVHKSTVNVVHGFYLDLLIFGTPDLGWRSPNSRHLT